MLGTLGEQSDDGVHEERAIFGEGADNTLVVLRRQMLGGQLDGFDDEPEGAETQPPFCPSSLKSKSAKSHRERGVTRSYDDASRRFTRE